MNNSNSRKANFLGMPHGTAYNKLKKAILFNCVQKLNEDICFVCGQKIETIEEFSIEHKLPWEGRDIALFWDLNNIAFSHVKCNRPHIYGEALRKIGPEGTAWCTKHKKFFPVEYFGVNNTRWNNLADECLNCSRNRKRIYDLNKLKKDNNET